MVRGEVDQFSTVRHSREGGNPVSLRLNDAVVPAFAGTTRWRRATNGATTKRVPERAAMTEGESSEHAQGTRGAQTLIRACRFYSRPRCAFNGSCTCFSEFEQAA